MGVLARLQERTSIQVPGRADMLLGSRSEASEDSASFRENAINISKAGIPKPIAFAIARVEEYREANGLSFDEAMRMVGGQVSNFSHPTERLWLRVFGERVEEVGVQRAAMDATKAVQENVYETPIEDAPSSSALDTRGLDWRRTLYKVPAWHFAHLLYQHPDLQKTMDKIIGRDRVTMKHIADIYEKLQSNPIYREFLNLVRIQMGKIYGPQYYGVMDEPLPPTMTAKTPRMITSGTSGGGAIALRSGATGESSTYL